MRSYSEYRADARFHLRGTWGNAIGLTLIMILSGQVIRSLAGTLSGGGGYHAIIKYLSRFETPGYELRPDDLERLYGLMKAMIRTGFIAQIFMIIAGIFLLDPLQTSVNNWFIRNRETPAYPTIGMVFQHFGANYGKLLGGRFWERLWLFIWSIPQLLGGVLLYIYNARFFVHSALVDILTDGNPGLFVEKQMIRGLPLLVIAFIMTIVGVILVINRRFAYAMTPYILADNPGIGAKKALKLSVEMMRGNKFRYFVLQLTFLGWMFLSIFTCAIGFFFVSAYMAQTNAEFYADLRSRAAMSGLASMEDFGFVSEGDGSNVPPYGNFGPQGYQGYTSYGSADYYSPGQQSYQGSPYDPYRGSSTDAYHTNAYQQNSYEANSYEANSYEANSYQPEVNQPGGEQPDESAAKTEQPNPDGQNPPDEDYF